MKEDIEVVRLIFHKGLTALSNRERYGQGGELAGIHI